MTPFEEFALNHGKHEHCIGCGGCLLDPLIKTLELRPVWCVTCRDRIEAALPKGVRRPWAGGVIFTPQGTQYASR